MDLEQTLNNFYDDQSASIRKRIEELESECSRIERVKSSSLDFLTNSKYWRLTENTREIERPIISKVGPITVFGWVSMDLGSPPLVPKWRGGLVKGTRKIVSSTLRSHWYANGASWHIDSPASICLGTAKSLYYSAVNSRRYGEACSILEKLLQKPPEVTQVPYMSVAEATGAAWCKNCNAYVMAFNKRYNLYHCMCCFGTDIKGVFIDFPPDKIKAPKRVSNNPIQSYTRYTFNTLPERSTPHSGIRMDESIPCQVCETTEQLMMVNHHRQVICVVCYDEGNYWWCEKRTEVELSSGRILRCGRFCNFEAIRLICNECTICHVCKRTGKIRYVVQGWPLCTQRCVRKYKRDITVEKRV